jgi:hypothetical protein
MTATVTIRVGATALIGPSGKLQRHVTFKVRFSRFTWRRNP